MLRRDQARGARLAEVLAVALCAASFDTAAAAGDPQPNRIKIEYVEPKDPAHQPIYNMIKEQKALEKLQEIFAPFKFPIDVNLKTIGCDGVSNAWYQRPTLTICYEYLADIRKTIPKETTADGVTPQDAMIGQFLYVVAHEMGHASFDLLNVPLFGRPEDAADQFAAYMMLQLGKSQARRLIAGAAYSYKDYVENKRVTVPQTAFADVHGAPMQRFYNLLCIGYGADREAFADLVTKGYLPESRAPSCRVEYGEINFAFQQLIVPQLDKEMAKAVLDKTWLPELPKPEPPPAPPNAASAK
jgi:hypothetical protein